MPDDEFNDVIAAARQKASEREVQAANRRDGMMEAIRSKRDVLHTVVHRVLLQAWRALESAGVKASVDTGANSRGEWQIALKVADKPHAPALVFSVISGLAVHLVCSKEYQTPREEVNYDLIDDATPVEIAQIVSDYLSETLG
ncbi:hypothetical protein [Luteolibacter soli]|uniref:Uncharacterized protein n=1 Tax=Luteolibacter soli TaxID=3135280 RepID=A0ABU9AZU9_9BACT